MAQTFAAWVSDEVKKREGLLLAVFKRAVELLADELRTRVEQGGRTPWETGNMVRSLNAVINGLVQIADGPFETPGDIEAKVAQLVMGDSIHIGYQANYARPRNYGTIHMQGSYHVEYAASLWPTMVALANEELKGLAS